MQPYDPSKICVACGLCCSGVLFAWLPVLPEERRRVEARALPVFENKLGPALALPCAALGSAGCAIYADRPTVCAEYRCKLLKDYLDGAVAIDRAVAIVAQAKAALAYAECHLAGEDRTLTIWDRAEHRARTHGTDPQSYRRANAELVENLARLKDICRRHFRASTDDHGL